MPKTLYFDCFSGASGDMILGALIDLGLPIEGLRGALGSLAIDYGEVGAERVSRAGVAATKFRLSEHTQTAGGTHRHRHHHLKQIVASIRRSSLAPASQQRAVQLFERLAEAEAAIHDTPIERVHLHEVGALDSIIDIAGAVYGFEWFGIDDVVSSPLNVGGGTVACAHGTFPVPAPATARLLTGVPIYGTGHSELVTPTGALLVTGYAREFGPLPLMAVERIGYGAGDRDPKGTPNVLRILLGERVHESNAAERSAERVVTVECEIDDMNPQLFGPLMDRLSEAGALDVFYAAVQMKKNRPGTLVTVIAPPDRREAIAGVLFAHTTTIGVRYQEMRRDRLDREIRPIETPLGAIRFKVATRDGRVLNAAPEFDDCARVAGARGMPIKDVQAIATRSWLNTQDRPED
ncbi:MAG: nickel pincer cofactor biosynthesis protein LarC [Acidobacteriota bacterium]